MRHIIDKYLYLDNNSYLLVADFGKFPLMQTTNRYFDVGLSETLLVNTAIGLALCKKHVYIYSAANFVLYRAYEQIKLYISCNNKINITFLNGGAGFCYTGCGIGHYLLDDIIIAKQLNLNCLLPYDQKTTISCLLQTKSGINYVRLCLDNAQKNLQIKYKKNNFDVYTIGWLVEYLCLINQKYHLNANIIPITNLSKLNFKRSYIIIYDNEYFCIFSNNKFCKASLYITNKYECIGYTYEQILNKYKLDEKSIINFFYKHIK